jgi:hypothetical protein
MALLAALLLATSAQDPPPAPKDARELFKSALIEAKASKKRVFLTFGSPG